MRGLNLKEIMSKSNMNQQGLNIATYGQAYCCLLLSMCAGSVDDEDRGGSISQI